MIGEATFESSLFRLSIAAYVIAAAVVVVIAWIA